MKVRTRIAAACRAAFHRYGTQNLTWDTTWADMFPVPPPPELAQFYGPPDLSAPASVAIVVAETEGTGSESSEQQSVSEEESQSDEPLVEISSESEPSDGDSSPVPPSEAPVDDPSP